MPDQPDVSDPSEPASHGDGTSSAEGSDDGGGDGGGGGDLRDRFRAALERKRGEAHERAVRGHGALTPKVHEHGRAGGKRAFRRKSG